MRIQRCLAIAMLTGMFMNAHAEASCDAKDECAAKICELDAAIEAARKEGSMRKLAMLKDMRVDALRCANRNKAE